MKKTCEDCKYYQFYDSAYGRCLRFPPHKYSVIKSKLFGIENQIKITYPLVSYDFQICGEFNENTT